MVLIIFSITYSLKVKKVNFGKFFEICILVGRAETHAG